MVGSWVDHTDSAAEEANPRVCGLLAHAGGQVAQIADGDAAKAELANQLAREECRRRFAWPAGKVVLGVGDSLGLVHRELHE